MSERHEDQADRLFYANALSSDSTGFDEAAPPPMPWTLQGQDPEEGLHVYRPCICCGGIVPDPGPYCPGCSSTHWLDQ